MTRLNDGAQLEATHRVQVAVFFMTVHVPVDRRSACEPPAHGTTVRLTQAVGASSAVTRNWMTGSQQERTHPGPGNSGVAQVQKGG